MMEGEFSDGWMEVGIPVILGRYLIMLVYLRISLSLAIRHGKCAKCSWLAGNPFRASVFCGFGGTLGDRLRNKQKPLWQLSIRDQNTDCSRIIIP